MAKMSFLLIVLCGLASLGMSFGEPTSYGGMPAPAKYEAPAMEEKYPMKAEYKKMEEKEKKYEAPAMYEEKKDKYPVKSDYKKMEEKYEEKKEKPQMKAEYKKMEDGGKKMYKRSVDDETEETANDAKKVTKVKANIVSIKKINQLKDAVMQDILADPIWGLGFGYRRYRRYPYFGLYRPYPYYGLGYRRFGYRRFGYRRFFDGEQDAASAQPAGHDFDNDDDTEELDAVPTPQGKWWNDDDQDQLMDDAAQQGKWWSPEEFDEIMDPLPARRTCSMRGGRRVCWPRRM